MNEGERKESCSAQKARLKGTRESAALPGEAHILEDSQPPSDGNILHGLDPPGPSPAEQAAKGVHEKKCGKYNTRDVY